MKGSQLEEVDGRAARSVANLSPTGVLQPWRRFPLGFPSALQLLPATPYPRKPCNGPSHTSCLQPRPLYISH